MAFSCISSFPDKYTIMTRSLHDIRLPITTHNKYEINTNMFKTYGVETTSWANSMY